jgi:hypothetical protein
MTEKTRSPAKQPSSPNPRPKQQNRQTSVDRFFALKPLTRSKIDEAMSSNVVDSPHVSDNESNNPYDVLRDDDDDEAHTDDDADEVPTDMEQKESEDDSLSNNSARPSDPSESEYESAMDSMSLVGKKKQRTSVDSTPPTALQTQASLEPYATPDSNSKTLARSTISTNMEQGSPDSKPPAKINPTMVKNSSNQDASDPQNIDALPMNDASRRLFENRKSPSTTADEISPSVLDDLLYNARQYDTTLLATSGVSIQASSQSGPNKEFDQEKNTKLVSTLQHGFRPAPTLPQGGRGRGGRFSHPNHRPGIQHILSSHQQSQGTEIGNQTQNMDTNDPSPEVPEQAPEEPDFSFTRPIYSSPTPPSPSRKQFFRCTWRIDIPKNTPPEDGLRDAILEIWGALKEADRRVIIYPWHQSAHGRYKALSDMSKFPKKKETLVRYFKDAYFCPHAGCTFVYTLVAT